MDNDTYSYRKDDIITGRYRIDSSAFTKEYEINGSHADIHIYSATDQRLDMPVSVLVCPLELDPHDVVDTITGSINTDSVSNQNSILDYFEAGGILHIIINSIPENSLSNTLASSSSSAFSASSASSVSPSSMISAPGRKKTVVRVAAAAAAILAVLIIVFAFSKKNSPSDSSADASPADVSSASAAADAASDDSLFSFDDSKYYRIIMYPKEDVTDEQKEKDTDVLTARLDAFCGGRGYELSENENNLCVLVPKDAVSDIDSLDYLCGCFIASRFELFTSRIYEKEDSGYYNEVYLISHDDLKDVSIGTHDVDEASLKEFSSAINNDELSFPYTDSYPCVAFTFTDEFIKDHGNIEGTDTPYIDSAADTNFTVGEIMDDKYARFRLVDEAQYEYGVFVPQIYLSGSDAYVENALNLIMADFIADELSCDYEYSISGDEITWLDENSADYYGSSQCAFNELDGDYALAEFRVGDRLSTGQLYDIENYICFVMDSLNIPYSVGYKESYDMTSDQKYTIMYIASGYEHMGIPVMNLLASCSFYRSIVFDNGSFRIPVADSSTAEKEISGKYNDRVFILDPGSSEHAELIENYLTEAKDNGMDYVCISIGDQHLFKASCDAASENGNITFNELAIGDGKSDWLWDFTDALFNAPDSGISLEFEGFRLNPLDKDMDTLADMFEIQLPKLSDGTLAQIEKACPEAEVSYQKDLSGGIYTAKPGRVYIDLNLDTTDDFPAKSLSLVKEISKICGIEHDPALEHLNFKLTDESAGDLERARVTVFRYEKDIDSFILDYKDSDMLAGMDDFADYLMENASGSTDIDYMQGYHNYFPYDFSNPRQPDPGIHSSGFICNGRMQHYIDTFRSILSEDEWYDYPSNSLIWFWTQFDSYCDGLLTYIN